MTDDRLEVGGMRDVSSTDDGSPPIAAIRRLSWPCGCAVETPSPNPSYADRIYVCPVHRGSEARPRWREVIYV